MGRKRVGIVLFENIEVLDFCGPFEVFSATRLNEERRRQELSPFEVLLVAEKNDPVAKNSITPQCSTGCVSVPRRSKP